MPKLVIDNLNGGLSPRYWEDSANIIVPGDNFYVEGFINPLFRTGFIYPISGDYTEIVGDTSSDPQLSGEEPIVQYVHTLGEVTQSGTDYVWLFQGRNIHLLNLNNQVIDESAVKEVGTEAGDILRDAVSYQVNGSAKILYGYFDDIGSMGHGGSSQNDNLWSTDSTGGAALDYDYDIVMEVSDNGFLYVGNGNYLYKYDGTSNGGANGTVSTALTFIAPLHIVDMVDHSGFLWIATEQYLYKQESESYDEDSDKMIGIYIWDRKTTEIGQENFIVLDGAVAIYAIFVMNGIIYCIIQDKSGVVKLMGYASGRFIKVRELGISDDGNDDARPSHRNSIKTYRNGIVYHARGGTIFYYGSITDGFPEALHKLGRRQSDATDEYGALFVAKDDTFYVNTIDSDSDRLEMFEPVSSSASVASNVFFTTKYYQLPSNSRITWVKIFFKGFTASSSSSLLQVNMFKNFSGVSLFSSAKQFNCQEIDSKGYITFPIGGSIGQDVQSVAFQILFDSLETIITSPGIYRIEVEYEPTTKKF